MRYKATVGERDFEIVVDGPDAVVVDGEPVDVDLQPIDGNTLYSVIIDNRSHELHVERIEGMWYVVIEGDRYPVDVGQARLKELIAMSQRGVEHASGATVTAPMPGLVVKTLVKDGDEVAVDQPLLILEAMKMENEIRSPAAGIVRRLVVEDGATVNEDDLLVTIESPDEPAPSGDDGEDA